MDRFSLGHVKCEMPIRIQTGVANNNGLYEPAVQGRGQGWRYEPGVSSRCVCRRGVEPELCDMSSFIG